MMKVLGVLAVLILVFIATAVIEPRFMGEYNQITLLRRVSLYGILSIGAAFVIISGGIDLSIGSVVALVGCLLPMLMMKYELSIAASLGIVSAVSLGIGLIHGLLITKMKLQPFVVTLCGLLIYRGVARWITSDATQGFGSTNADLRQLVTGNFEIPGGYFLPNPLLVLIALAVLGGVFLNLTVFGRYLLALGRNEQAARYSGINTDLMTILSYVICSLCAGLGGVMFSLDLNSMQPSNAGNFFELYAIAAAVLGGCSLRGGEGSMFGVLVGTALIQTLYSASNALGIPSQLEFATIGVVILAGVVLDEVARRVSAVRRLQAARSSDPQPPKTAPA